jgi:ribosome biogenesis protein ENP2
MHGYFMDLKLYYKLKALSEPFAYEEYRKERVKQRIQSKLAERITVRKRKRPAMVNADLATELAQKKSGQSLLADDRFSSLFTDKKFEVDTENEVYQRLHSSKRPRPQEEEDDFEYVPEAKEAAGLVEDVQTSENSLPFKSRVAEEVRQVKKKKVKQDKLLKTQKDMKGRRTAVPLRSLLASKKR